MCKMSLYDETMVGRGHVGDVKFLRQTLFADERMELQIDFRKASFICVLKLISKPDSHRYSDHPASVMPSRSSNNEKEGG